MFFNIFNVFLKIYNVFIYMNNKDLPNDQFYTAQPAIIKKLKEPALSKIYTYPIDKNIKWYKPFPQFPNADQDKYFFKYEYIRALRNKMENLQQSLYEEQLREALENEMEFNEIKRQDRQIQALNNYFKAGVFSFIMNDVKDKYLQNQAKELAKNNSVLTDIDNKIADIRKDDLDTLSLDTENSRIEEEIYDIQRVRESIIQKKIDEFDEDDEEDLERLKDTLNEMEKGFYIPRREERKQNETLVEVGELQDTEITEMLHKIDNETKTELIEKRQEKEQLEKTLEEEKIKLQKEQQALQKKQERKDKVGDFKTKITIQKNINKGYLSNLKQITNNIRSFEKNIGKLTAKGSLVNQLKLAYELDYLSREQLDTILNNFPNIKKSNKQERINIKTNFNDLFRTLNEGYVVDLKQFIDGITYDDMIEGLEKQPFRSKYNKLQLEQLKEKTKKYLKEETELTGLGLKTGLEKLQKGEQLQKEIELFLDLETLIPGVQEGLWEELPPISEVQSPRTFEEEGGAF